MFHKIKNGIENLIKWFPVIWNDRQFDHRYLLEIMEKKLELMEEFFDSEYAMTLDAHKTAKQIRIAKNLISRLKEDEYEDKFFETLHQKWGEFKFRNGSMEIENVKTEEDEKEYSKDLRIAVEQAYVLRVQDKELFCKYFIKKLDGWWD